VLFNSYEFIFVLLPLSFFVYFYLTSKKLLILAKVWLIFVSLFFYGWWNIIYLPILIISILFNYTIAKIMTELDPSSGGYFSKKLLLQLGVLLNIGLLLYFKYMDFFISNTNTLFNYNFELLNLALPLAISFFTLQQVGFLIDSYEGLIKQRNFIDYTIFVTFFPQLISGPIVRHKDMMPQFSSIKNKVKNYKNIAIGLFIFSIGLFKKVVIADTFAVWANNGFDTTNALNFLEAWATSLSYTFQVYFDFSGYTDMAIGAALLFNIKLPINFNSPYKATGIIDFWQRWHISLTNFIGTYVHTPMVRSFNTITFNKIMFATLLTFLIVGLWHGDSWIFVIFGLLHGIGSIINHYWKKRKRKMNKVLAWFITFNFVNLTFVLFRAKDWSNAMNVLSSMFSFQDIGTMNINLIVNYSYIFLSFLIVLLMKNTFNLSSEIANRRINTNVLVFSLTLFFFSLLQINAFQINGFDSPFLYFNF
jgi:alginate O-acetyltransferase complex protein AlgI